MSDKREMGIDFGDLPGDLADENYPLSRDELVEKYGDRELEHASGATTVEEVVDPEQREEFDGPDAVKQTILNMVGTGAVGRDRYSDRGGTTPEDQQASEGEGDEPNSL